MKKLISAVLNSIFPAVATVKTPGSVSVPIVKPPREPVAAVIPPLALILPLRIVTGKHRI